MKPTLKAGLKHRFAYTVPESKTVPALYREAQQLQVMPEVFATGFMVGLMEWTCVQLLEPHLEKGEGSWARISRCRTRPQRPWASPSRLTRSSPISEGPARASR